MFPSNSAPEWLTLLKREVSRAISALFLIAGYEGSDKLFKKSVVASAWSSWGLVWDIRLNKNKKVIHDCRYMEHKSTLEDAVSCSGVQNIQVSTKKTQFFLSSFILKGFMRCLIYQNISLFNLRIYSFSFLPWIGRKFNKNGELTAQWWSQDSLDGFNAKAKCVENQYSMYKVRDKYPVSRKLTG